MKIVTRNKSRPARIWGCVIAAAALSGCHAAPLDSAADDRSDGADSALAVGSLGTPIVVPPDECPGGVCQAEWSAIWWQQILAIPFGRNPVFDTTGKDCDEGAHEGPHGDVDVWFLAGTTGGSVTRTCTIPTGTRIFFPLVNTSDDNNSCNPPLDCSGFATLEDCLTEDAHKLLKPETLFAEVDGNALVDNPFLYDQTSKLFFFTGQPSLKKHFDPCITGRPQEAVAYGWWIMLEPLQPKPNSEPYTLRFGGTGTFGGFPFAIDATYKLYIGPPRHPPR